jgi:hypothetical protein
MRTSGLRRTDRPEGVLHLVVLFGAAAVLLTEGLSLLHALRRGPLAVAWVGVFLVVAAWFRLKFVRPRLRPVEIGVWIVIAAIAAAIATAAWMSPPNSADAMAYHMPRVVYWAQNASVAFFPTTYYNQVMLGPMAEYLMLHTYILSGGDHFVNLLTFGAWLVAVIGVWSLAGALGLGTRGQAFAALFAATLPNGILQASGAKNDCLLTAWLVLMAYFAARREVMYAGLAFGLAVATKATAFLFAPPILVAIMLPIEKRPPYRLLLWLAGGALLINTPQFVRNMRLSGSPLGCDSAFCDGTFRWRNERLGWKATASNLLRNFSEQLGSRSAKRNQEVYDAVVRIHRALGLDPQDPETTWRWAVYVPPKNANHEADANNRWHLLLAALAVALALVRRQWKWVLYAGALAAALLLFCFYLKWQPFMARLELPLYVLAAPVAGWALESIRPAALALLPCLWLASIARLPATENWTRPLKGPASLFRTAREDNYFRDMVQWNNGPSYREAAERVAAAGCGMVTVDITWNQLEYPFEALLRDRNPRARFQHQGPACAVLCLDCAPEHREKLAQYAGYGPPVQIGRFWLFLDQFRK